jgi:hypothetical protein
MELPGFPRSASKNHGKKELTRFRGMKQVDFFANSTIYAEKNHESELYAFR